jgi:thiol-disulfide isomerase/thioredoxin
MVKLDNQAAKVEWQRTFVAHLKLEVPPLKTLKMLALAILLAVSAGTASSAGRDIYPDPSQAKGDVAAALKTAAASHKRVLIDFGGNWCGDCQVLDLYFHDAANLPILDANFVLVHVNIGRMDVNQDIAEKYAVPLQKGVPALAVLSDKGTLLYSQKTGEFESMRRMESSAVTSFLVQWKPVKAGCSTVMVNC